MAAVNTKSIGDVTVLSVATALAKMGETVLFPFGDNERYDIALDRDGQMYRIQCKTGRYSNGVIEFNTSSTSPYLKGRRRTYHGEVEAFGVYCLELDKVYLVPLAEVPTETCALLRVLPTRNQQARGVRFAETYEIGICKLSSASIAQLVRAPDS